jgi:hypothetical protein
MRAAPDLSADGVDILDERLKICEMEEEGADLQFTNQSPSFLINV